MAAKSATKARSVTRRAKTVERAADPGSESADERMPNLPDWRWRSFPVVAAFIAGVLLDSIVNPPASNAAVVLRVLAVLGAGYCLAHVFVVNTIVARRIKARHKAMAAGDTDEDEDEWVDEVVHPDDDANATAGQPRGEAHLTR